MNRILLTLLLMPVLHTVAAQSSLTKADNCYLEKNYACAINFYSEALANNQYDPKVLYLIQHHIGYGNLKLKKFTEAISYLQKSISSKPDYGPAYWDLAAAYYQSEQWEKAAEYYGKAANFYSARLKYAFPFQ